MLIAQPGNLQNKFLLAQSYEQSGDLNRAIEIYEEVYNAQPANYQFFLALNKIYIQNKNYDKAIFITEQRLQLTPGDYNLIGMLGVALYLKGDEAKAFKLWEETINQNQDNQNLYRTFANYSIELRLFDKAIEILNRGKNRSQVKTIYSYDLANLYTMRMQYGDAIKEYLFLIDNDPNQAKSIESRILQMLSRPDAVPIVISALEEKNSAQNPNYAMLLTSAYLENSSFEKAVRINIELDKKNNLKGIEVFNLAQRLYYLRQYSQASIAYEYVLKKYSDAPFIPQIKLGFAKTFEAALEEKVANVLQLWKPLRKSEIDFASEYEKSIIAYEDIIKSFNNNEAAIEAYFRIGQIFELRLKNYEKAKTNYLAITERYKLSSFYSSANEALARISLAENNLIEAEKYLNEIISFPRTSPDSRNLAKFRKAELKYFSGKFDEAKNILSEILGVFKDNIANDAIELSILLNTSINDSSLLIKFASAEYLAFKENFTEAITLLEEIEKVEDAIFLANQASITKMECFIALSNYAMALQIGEKLIQQENLNLFADKALFLSAQIYQFGILSDKKAKELYEQLLIKHPGSLYLDKAREEINYLRNKLS